MFINLKSILLAMLVVSTIMPNTYAIKLDSNNYFTSESGKPLYYYVIDVPNSGITNCYGSCSVTWNPLNPEDTSTLPSSIRGNFGTIFRSDGVTQMTYNGRPLYMDSQYTGETVPKDDIDHLWFLVRPS